MISWLLALLASSQVPYELLALVEIGGNVLYEILMKITNQIQLTRKPYCRNFKLLSAKIGAYSAKMEFYYQTVCSNEL